MCIRDSNSLEHHLTVIVAFYIFCWPLLFVSYVLCAMVTGEEFFKRPFRKQLEVSSHMAMIPHHMLCTYFGLRTVFSTCGLGAAARSEDSCWGYYTPENSLTNMISVGYFLFDLTIIFFVSRDFSPLTMQSIYHHCACLLYTSPSPRDATLSRMPSSA